MSRSKGWDVPQIHERIRIQPRTAAAGVRRLCVRGSGAGPPPVRIASIRRLFALAGPRQAAAGTKLAAVDRAGHRNRRCFVACFSPRSISVSGELSKASCAMRSIARAACRWIQFSDPRAIGAVHRSAPDRQSGGVCRPVSGLGAGDRIEPCGRSAAPRGPAATPRARSIELENLENIAVIIGPRAERRLRCAWIMSASRKLGCLKPVRPRVNSTQVDAER